MIDKAYMGSVCGKKSRTIGSLDSFYDDPTSDARVFHAIPSLDSDEIIEDNVKKIMTGGDGQDSDSKRLCIYCGSWVTGRCRSCP